MEGYAQRNRDVWQTERVIKNQKTDCTLTKKGDAREQVKGEQLDVNVGDVPGDLLCPVL